MAKPVHVPIAYHVSRWTEDPLIKGAWSQLLVDGSPLDRINLGTPVSPSFVIAGEACDPDMPGMVHGAYKSGLAAAEYILKGEPMEENCQIVIIGAGAAGIAAAKELLAKNTANAKVLILEARNRLGGRVNTVPLGNTNGLAESDIIYVDAGATWLHQYPVNMLAEDAQSFKCELVSSDFLNPLRASIDGVDAHDPIKFFNNLLTTTANASQIDKSLACVIESVRGTYVSEEDRRVIEKSIVDVMSDSGVTTAELSARHGLEPGVGNTDFYFKRGFGSLISRLAEGLPITYNTAVKAIDWGGPDCRKVKLTTNKDEVFVADRCICTVPVSMYQNDPLLKITPELPELHRKCLDHIKLGLCEKVIMRFETRWWPVNPGGILRWYGGSLDAAGQVIYGDTWVDWLDLTDGVGHPVVMGFIYGQDSVTKCHAGKTDLEVALNATLALEHWAQQIEQGNKNATTAEVSRSEDVERDVPLSRRSDACDTVDDQLEGRSALPTPPTSSLPAKILPPSPSLSIDRSDKGLVSSSSLLLGSNGSLLHPGNYIDSGALTLMPCLVDIGGHA